MPYLRRMRQASTGFGSLLNNARSVSGAGGVTHDARLANAAQAHAEDMLRNNYFSHEGLNGSTLGARVRAAGYTPGHVGENIAQGQQTEAEVFESWMNSSGHRKNNLNPKFNHFGLGTAGSGSQKRWVLVLAQ